VREHAAAGPISKSRFPGVSQPCRDGPAGRLYGALTSSEILGKKTRAFGLIVQLSSRFRS